MTESKTNTKTEEFHISGAALIDKIKELIHEGNVRQLTLADEDGDFRLEMPLTVGVLAGGAVTLVAPWLAIIGVVAGLVTKVKVVVEREEEDMPPDAPVATREPVDPV
jgi:hypothetical protein